MTYSRDNFFSALLDALGAPKSHANFDALRAWGECEGSEAAYNPLDTTQHEDGATPYNTFGNNLHVWNYPDQETGVRATVTTLRNGYYPHILHALMAGTGAIVTGDARSEMRVWGTNPDCIDTYLAKPPPTPSTARTFPTQQRENVQRVRAYLNSRHHRLDISDKLLLKQLKAAIRHAEGIR